MNDMKRKIVEMLDKDIRIDGRKRNDFRKIKIEYGISKTAEGSARVTLGDTIVIAGVKLETMTPYPDRPDEGSLMVGAELLPMSSPDFEAGPPSEWATEVARVVDRGIRECHAIDFSKLLIKKGEKAWVVIADICTINDAGNIMDASNLAVLAAMKDTKFPTFDGTNIDYKTPTKEKLKLDELPIAITVSKMGKQLLVDTTNEEEKLIDARLTVAMIEDGKLCSMQKGGEGPLTTEEISKMIDIATEHSKKLRKML
jgi:exosome complex component RRP42